MSDYREKYYTLLEENNKLKDQLIELKDLNYKLQHKIDLAKTSKHSDKSNTEEYNNLKKKSDSDDLKIKELSSGVEKLKSQFEVSKNINSGLLMQIELLKSQINNLSSQANPINNLSDISNLENNSHLEEKHDKEIIQKPALEQPLNQIDIFQAVKGCDLETIKSAISNGLDINILDKDNETPVMKACYYGFFSVAKFLIENGCLLNIKNNDGMNALMIACQNEYFDIVSAIVEKGFADINETSNEGETALMYASESGNLDIVKFLVVAGADIHIRNTGGMNAQMKASWNDYEDISNFLKDVEINGVRIDDDKVDEMQIDAQF